MRRLIETASCAGTVLFLAVQAASAADIAMIAGSGDTPSEEITVLGDVLNARGYEVYDRRISDRADLAAALAEVAGRLSEADRLILIYIGDVEGQGPRAWLLPPDYEGTGRIDAALGGLPLDLLLDMAAEVPGRSAVIIGTDTAADARGDFLTLSPGVGAPVPPQGVLLLAGPEATVVRTVMDGLLGDAASVSEALAEAPDDLEIFGFRSPEAAFTHTEAVPPPADREVTEPTPPAAAPASAAERAEAALALDQTARRGIQERLTVLGYDTRGIDGLFGPGTRGAVAAWQTEQDLAATGFVTAEQLDLLTALADARSAELAAAAERARMAEEAADAAFWRTTGANGAPADLRAYLARYPEGVYASEARATLERQDAEARAAAGQDDRTAWEAAETANRIPAYRRYLEAFPDGVFAESAQARIAALRAEPDQARSAEGFAAAEEALGLGQGSRALIEGQLAALGFETGEPDGTFDRASRRSLRQFQTREGLPVTGYVDQETVRALIVASLGLR